MESSKNKQVKKICIICGKEFIGHFNAKVCSEKCRLEKNKLSGRRFRNNVKEKKFINSIKDYDYVECPICHEKHEQISLNHFQIHGYKNIEDIRKDFPTFKMTCQKFIDNNLAGENNPMSKENTTLEQRKKASPNTIEHWLEKFNGDKEKAEYALKMHREKVHEKQKTAIQGTNPNYYIHKGYSLEEAKQIIHEKYITNGLSYYIKKYGEEIGTKKYNERINKWLDNFTHTNHSIIADRCISNIIENIDTTYLRYSNNEYIIQGINNNYYKVDLINLQNRHIIEFFGDQWHCNPIKYKPNDYNRHNKKTAQEIWDYDKERIKSLEFLGYKVLIIWEYDYIHNTNNIINNAREFILS